MIFHETEKKPVKKRKPSKPLSSVYIFDDPSGLKANFYLKIKANGEWYVFFYAFYDMQEKNFQFLIC